MRKVSLMTLLMKRTS